MIQLSNLRLYPLTFLLHHRYDRTYICYYYIHIFWSCYIHTKILLFNWLKSDVISLGAQTSPELGVGIAPASFIISDHGRGLWGWQTDHAVGAGWGGRGGGREQWEMAVGPGWDGGAWWPWVSSDGGVGASVVGVAVVAREQSPTSSCESQREKKKMARGRRKDSRSSFIWRL